MSSRCLWHACRALCAGLLLMLLGAAMATIGYYADTLSVAQEIRGNATVSVKDEARGFHLNNLSYAGPIVMGFGGFIVVAACVMTFEARDSAAKVTPARPAAAPRPVPRLASTAGVARWDQLGVYRLPALPLPPLPHAHPHRRSHARIRVGGAIATGHSFGKSGYSSVPAARFGSAPDLRTAARVAPPVNALRRPLRRYALSVDEAPHSTHSASAAESECGSQSSLALDLHAPAGGGAGASGVTLRVRDNTRRRPPPLARQPRLRDESHQICMLESRGVSPSRRSSLLSEGDETSVATIPKAQLQVWDEAKPRACSAPPPPRPSSPDHAIAEPAVIIVESSSERIGSSEVELPSPVRPPSPPSPHPPAVDTASPSASPPPPLEDISIAIEEDPPTEVATSPVSQEA